MEIMIQTKIPSISRENYSFNQSEYQALILFEIIIKRKHLSKKNHKILMLFSQELIILQKRKITSSISQI